MAERIVTGVEAPSDAERRERVTAEFTAHFGRPPELFVRAPGRVDAMGSHTDYNDGFVLTMSIDRDTWIAASPRSDGRVYVRSLNLEGHGDFAIEDVMKSRSPGWALYVQAVAAILAREGHALTGCDALIHGRVPIASGLSSSASLEAATAVLFAALGGYEIERVRMAQLCQAAENEIVGVSCGILDQYSSILGEAGSALLLDCRHLRHEYARIPASLRPVVCDTRSPRALSGSAYGERRSSCEAGARALAEWLPDVKALRDVSLADFVGHEAKLPAVVARRCRFVIEENARVHALARALGGDDRPAIGALCADSFAGARDLYEITIASMESMFDAMVGAPGVVGARQAGAGFGGCMVAFVEAARVDDFVAATASAYQRATGVRPEIHPVSPVGGAGVLTGG
jgi:galactokinase